MGFLARRRQRRERLAAPFPDAWRALLARELAPWPHLDQEERSTLEELVQRLVVLKRWEAAHGFELTEEMQVVIAAHAALLVVHIDGGDDCYRTVTSIVVHPTTIVLDHGEPVPLGPDDSMLMVDGPMELDGEAEYRGAVFLAWDAVADESRHPEGGEHVVYHEFAHRLDMLDHVVDGTPPVGGADHRQHWAEVCRAHFDALQHRSDPDGLLRDYAGTDAAEFFAVATEVFLTRGAALRERKPDLYEVLAGFYGHDPAAWRPGAGPGSVGA